MEQFSSDDKKIVDLLAKIKSSKVAYLLNLLTSYRQNYFKDVYRIASGMDLGAGTKQRRRADDNTAETW